MVKRLQSGFLQAILMISLLFSATAAYAGIGDTLKTVKARGVLNCPGHTASYLGFAEIDNTGKWTGLDIDMCKAVATAIFGSPDKLKIVPLSWAQRWPALQSGDVDIMIKTSGGTFQRNTDLGFEFSNAYYFGLTRVMAKKSLGLKSLKDADGGTVCVPAASIQERQIATFEATNKIKLEIVAIDKSTDMHQAYLDGRCDMLVAWDTELAGVRISSPHPDDHVILPDVLGLEPSVMLVRKGDDGWLDLANWTLWTLLIAERDGVTSANVDDMRAHPPTAEIAKMLGATPGFGTPLGLSDDWGYKVIKNVGNYAEIFDRNLGAKSPYKIDRALNALWTKGGLLFPMIID